MKRRFLTVLFVAVTALVAVALLYLAVAVRVSSGEFKDFSQLPVPTTERLGGFQAKGVYVIIEGPHSACVEVLGVLSSPEDAAGLVACFTEEPLRGVAASYNGVWSDHLSNTSANIPVFENDDFSWYGKIPSSHGVIGVQGVASASSGDFYLKYSWQY